MNALLVAGYAAAMIACLLAAGGPMRRAWLLLAALLALLAACRGLGLDGAATRWLSALAGQRGWYEGRRPAQVAVLLVTAAVAAIGVGMAVVRLRGTTSALAVAVTAAILLAAFTAARAVSLHQVDALLGRGIGPIRLGRVTEAALLLAIAAAALLARNGGG